MTIQTRISLLFTSIVASLLLFFCLIIYLLSEQHRQNEFYERLRAEAFASVELLFGSETLTPELFKLLDKNKITVLQQEEIIIFDQHNQIIYESGTDTVNIPGQVLNRIRREKEVRLRDGNKEMAGVYYKHADKSFLVVASAVDTYGFSKQQNLALLLTSGWLVATGVVFGVGWFFAGKFLQPINQVIRQVDTITASRLNLRVDEGNGKDEIARLAFRFNLMLDRLEESFQLQQEFVSNASHELRTPLTAITGQLEVALLTENTADELREILGSVLEDVRQLNGLSNGLLSLAGLSKDEVTVNFTIVRIDELIWQIQGELLKMQPFYKVCVEINDFPENEQDLCLVGSESLLRIALLNLLENGCKFSPNHIVQVRLKCLPDYLMLEFHNQGPSIPVEEIPFIFKPFYRGSHSRHLPGHGIGLPLTDKIVRLHNGSLLVHSTEDTGTTFTVILPRNF
jgi:signal transduction histidine kinase